MGYDEPLCTHTFTVDIRTAILSINLKVLRFQRGLTLEDVAQRAGLTRSYLSKVERGLSTPSIESALAIAKALGVTVDHLFGRPSQGDDISVFRADPAEDSQVPGGMTLVAGHNPGRVMRAFVIRPDRRVSRSHLMSHHQGEEILYVLEGEVELQIGRRKERLAKNDCIHFDSTMPHKLIAVGEHPSAVLVITSSLEDEFDESSEAAM